MISVLMPVHNGEKFLKDAIDSILGQTLKDFEFIIINDGSTDRTKEIIDSYFDERIVPINFESNKGIVEALNIGFSTAKYPVIARMDADDISLPNRLELQYRHLLEGDYDLVTCHSEFFGGYEKLVERALKDEDLKSSLFFNNLVGHPQLMLKKSALVDNNIYYRHDWFPCEDYKLLTELAKNARFSNVGEMLYRQRWHSSSVSNQKVSAQDRLAWSIIRDLHDEVLDVPDSLSPRCFSFLRDNDPQKLSITEFDLLLDYFSEFKVLIKSNYHLEMLNDRLRVLMNESFYLGSKSKNVQNLIEGDIQQSLSSRIFSICYDVLNYFSRR